MKNKLESLSGDMFTNFEKNEIGNLGVILGGRATKSGSTGWYSCDKGGSEQGNWFTTRKEARNDC